MSKIAAQFVVWVLRDTNTGEYYHHLASNTQVGSYIVTWPDVKNCCGFDSKKDAENWKRELMNEVRIDPKLVKVFEPRKVVVSYDLYGAGEK